MKERERRCFLGWRGSLEQEKQERHTQDRTRIRRAWMHSMHHVLVQCVYKMLHLLYTLILHFVAAGANTHEQLDKQSNGIFSGHGTGQV